MHTYLIERDIPGVEHLSPDEIGEAATVSNAALAQLAPRIEWIESFVTPGRTFCRYRAEGEDVIREHARLSGFPATRITRVSGMMDPNSAG